MVEGIRRYVYQSRWISEVYRTNLWGRREVYDDEGWLKSSFPVNLHQSSARASGDQVRGVKSTRTSPITVGFGLSELTTRSMKSVGICCSVLKLQPGKEREPRPLIHGYAVRVESHSWSMHRTMSETSLICSRFYSARESTGDSLADFP